MPSSLSSTAASLIVVMVNDYKPIEVKDLPQAVQETIKKDFADLTIKEAAVDEISDAFRLFDGDTEGRMGKRIYVFIYRFNI